MFAQSRVNEDILNLVLSYLFVHHINLNIQTIVGPKEKIRISTHVPLKLF